MIYDLSPPISAALPVWPGDTPFEHRLAWSQARGDSVNVGALTTTCHLGSHVDAPFHVDSEGGTLETLPLEAFVGPCRVLEVPPAPLVVPEHLTGVEPGTPPRLLLKTLSVGDRQRFPESFTALAPETVALLAAAGTRLVGLDTPSVDPIDSQDLTAHHRLFAAGIAILEGLVLDDVPPGVYELIALPLRIEGADGSPVRAILRPLRP